MLRAFWKVVATTIDRVCVSGAPSAKLSILTYHGVSEKPGSMNHCDVDRARFEKHAQALASAFTVLPLSEALPRLHSGTLPSRAACITFDDGYENNHAVALPILEQYGLVATFFVATGYLDGGWMFNDVIIDAVRRCSSSELDLTKLGLSVYRLDTLAEREAAILEIVRRTKYLRIRERHERAEAVREAAAVDLGGSLMMTSEQVCNLVERGMEVGGHTHQHPILNCEDDAVAVAEIERGKACLEEIVGSRIVLFAYPNGRPGVDYSSRHVAMVRRAGFRASFSTAPGVATNDDDVYQLPRFTPWDRSTGKFLVRLSLSRSQGVTERVS